MTDAALVAAWQGALAAEQRAFFAYGLIGPRVSGAQDELARTCSQAHQQLGDATEDSIATAKLTPVSPEADYPSLYPVDDADQARRAAVAVEEYCASAWRYLYARAASAGSSGASLRTTAQAGLTASAVRAAQWRQLVNPAAPTRPFPGI